MPDFNQTLLNELKDIHYPEMISWWPPAIGWWILALLISGSVVIGLILVKRAWKKFKQKRALLKELQRLRQQYQTNQENITEQLSILIKRTVMLHFPREQVAALQGQQWLDFLNRMTKTPYFTQELITAPYQATAPEQTMALLSETEQWLKNV